MTNKKYLYALYCVIVNLKRQNRNGYLWH